MYVHLPENDYNDLVAAANVADTVGETFTNDLVMQLLTSEEPRYELLTQAYKNKIVTEYKTKNATMEFKINGYNFFLHIYKSLLFNNIYIYIFIIF